MSWWNPVSWFDENADNWLGSVSGDIASGVEGATIAVIKDIMGVVLPWLEILAGAVIAILVLVVYFKGESIGTGISIARIFT